MTHKETIYPLILSKVFPAFHPLADCPTNFADKIEIGLKKHTIRTNYEWWHNRALKAADGNCVLSLRQWDERPYYSPQIEVKRLPKFKVQKLVFDEGAIFKPQIEWRRKNDSYPIVRLNLDIEELATNDGLTLTEWYWWFEKYDLTQPFAIIQFTDFLYI